MSKVYWMTPEELERKKSIKQKAFYIIMPLAVIGISAGITIMASNL